MEYDPTEQILQNQPNGKNEKLKVLIKRTCVNLKMLSMKRSTSCPSWSRKYSATVSPVRATRARAPGGSFICPYTRATLEVLSFREMTPPSIISWYKSLPSLVLSPTPANTEYPPWALATLLISSMINTVLPTPAPPNRPILPPFTYGARRSTTLMPVTRISWSTDMSANSGASAWMAANLSVLMGPRSSMGSPMTLMILPRVSSPTGILMGEPVSTTAWPLTRPSVPSMAMVRTVFSPKCWATSRTSLGDLFVTSRALRISGSPSSNWTSTTAPMTATIWPLFLAVDWLRFWIWARAGAALMASWRVTALPPARNKAEELLAAAPNMMSLDVTCPSSLLQVSVFA